MCVQTAPKVRVRLILSLFGCTQQLMLLSLVQVHATGGQPCVEARVQRKKGRVPLGAVVEVYGMAAAAYLPAMAPICSLQAALCSE